MTPRLVVVLGYSDSGRGELHPECAARLERAAEVTTADDVVVLSGWARVPHTYSEAELMRAAWRGAAHEVVVDPDARTTVENMSSDPITSRPHPTETPKSRGRLRDSRRRRSRRTIEHMTNLGGGDR